MNAPKTRFITVAMEVSDDATNEQIHEELCVLCHEQSMNADWFVDIKIDKGEGGNDDNN